MSARVAIYAVDLDKFEAFLNRSVREVVTQIYATAHDRGLQLDPIPLEDPPYHDGLRGRAYYITPEGSFNYVDPGAHSKNAAPLDDPFLAGNAVEHFRRDSSYGLYFLFERMSMTCDFVVELMYGFRPWVIEVLRDAELDNLVTGDEQARYIRLCQRVLRRYSSDPAGEDTYMLPDCDFPILPSSDVDEQMSVWNEGETRFMANIFRRIKDRPIRFDVRVGSRREQNDEWNSQIHEVIDQLLRIETLPPGRFRCVGFIG